VPLYPYAIRKIVTTKIFVKTICPGLCLIVQLVHAVESFGIRAHSLASKGLDKGAEPNNSVRGQLMKIYFKKNLGLPQSSRLEEIAVLL
jgi:hypothetical protein